MLANDVATPQHFHWRRAGTAHTVDERVRLMHDNGSDTGKIRALALLSGGLDSQLAVCVLRDQAIVVDGVAFDSPFFSPDVARRAARTLGIPLQVVNFTPDIIRLIQAPPHGFGSCLNPCIDCHATMLKRAGDMLDEHGYQFLATGEVLNERPMSQNRRSLEVVAESSGYADRIVRPLSARLLPATEPERRGWVDRSRLLALEGRGRKEQMRLAEHYGLTDYPSPAGGCRLTEPNFCRRLQDLKDHEGLIGERSLMLLRIGRHFRISDRMKVIIGRNEKDNAFLEGNAELYDIILKTEEVPGPTALLPFTATRDQILLAAALCARYSDSTNGNTVRIRVRSTRGVERMEIHPADESTVSRLRIG